MLWTCAGLVYLHTYAWLQRCWHWGHELEKCHKACSCVSAYLYSDWTQDCTREAWGKGLTTKLPRLAFNSRYPFLSLLNLGEEVKILLTIVFSLPWKLLGDSSYLVSSRLFLQWAQLMENRGIFLLPPLWHLCLSKIHYYFMYIRVLPAGMSM